MTFSTIKPDAGPSPKLDVDQIRTNFAQWATVLARNHTAMNKKFQGDHEAVTIENRVGDPGVTEDLTVLYNKNAFSALGFQPQLYVQIPKFLPTANDTVDAVNGGMQLTYNKVNIAGPQYQSFLTGGVLVFIGSTTTVGTTITLSPTPTSIRLAIAVVSKMQVVTPSITESFTVPYSISTTVLSASTFKINSDITNPFTIQWIVLAAA